MTKTMLPTVSTADYLDRILFRYSTTFDIHKPYQINGKEYPAYGFFSSHTEKYVLVREANMWSSDCYEHILFLTIEECTLALLKELYQLTADYMEPILVRKGEKFPPRNHMYSYLTFGIICEKSLSSEIKKALKRFKYEKGYQFNMLGFSQAHIICASMEEETVITNYTGRSSRTLYKEIFKEVREGKPGFDSLANSL